MERLNQLRQEYQQTKAVLKFPFSLEERQVERRSAILVEARALAASLNLTGTNWFDAEE